MTMPTPFDVRARQLEALATSGLVSLPEVQKLSTARRLLSAELMSLNAAARRQDDPLTGLVDEVITAAASGRQVPDVLAMTRSVADTERAYETAANILQSALSELDRRITDAVFVDDALVALNGPLLALVDDVRAAVAAMGSTPRTDRAMLTASARAKAAYLSLPDLADRYGRIRQAQHTLARDLMAIKVQVTGPIVGLASTLANVEQVWPNFPPYLNGSRGTDALPPWPSDEDDAIEHLVWLVTATEPASPVLWVPTCAELARYVQRLQKTAVAALEHNVERRVTREFIDGEHVVQERYYDRDSGVEVNA